MEIARDVIGERAQGANIECVEHGRAVAVGFARGDVDKARQESSEGFAATRGGDQERVLAFLEGGDHVSLIVAHGPILIREPVVETFWDERGRVGHR